LRLGIDIINITTNPTTRRMSNILNVFNIRITFMIPSVILPRQRVNKAIYMRVSDRHSLLIAAGRAVSPRRPTAGCAALPEMGTTTAKTARPEAAPHPTISALNRWGEPSG